MYALNIRGYFHMENINFWIDNSNFEMEKKTFTNRIYHISIA